MDSIRLPLSITHPRVHILRTLGANVQSSNDSLAGQWINIVLLITVSFLVLYNANKSLVYVAKPQPITVPAHEERGPVCSL